MRLRVARQDDAEAILDIYRPIVLDSHISFEYEPPDAAEMRRRIGRTLEDYPWIVAEDEGDDGRLLGYAYAVRFRGREAYDWSAETTIYVSPGRKRAGVGSVLIRGLLRCMREQGFHVAVAGIALPNPDSVAFHECVGFEKSGIVRRAGYKAGHWRDIGFWQFELRRADEDAPAAGTRLAPPRPFRELPLDDVEGWLRASAEAGSHPQPPGADMLR